MVSNVVYLIFAFILIAIAFMNIIGKWWDSWELKQALPKFIVWVLMVPFSWFFVSFIISISSILTVSALTLPFDSFDEKIAPLLEDIKILEGLANQDENLELVGANLICTKHIIYLWGKRETDKSIAEDSEENVVYECASDKDKMSFTDLMGKVFNDENNEPDSIYSIISLYTYGVMESDKINKLPTKKIDVTWGIKTVLDLTFDVLFNLVFMLVYIILLAALFIALFVRWILLWLYMIFSPVFGLLHFLWDKAPSDKFSIKEFISLALVPVYVSAALSFWLLFLLLAGSSDAFKWTEANTNEIKIGLFSTEIKWTIGWGGNTLWVASNLGQLIIRVFGLVIMWLWVMAALKSNTITAQVTAPIEQFGNQVWTLVAKAPMYAPIVPGIWGGKNQSISSLW